jgi:hypothetical protein
MELSVEGPGPTGPFLSARTLFETEHDLAQPVRVQVRADPDERTWAAHYQDEHVLNISQQAACSAMARELALHELAHMRRHEQAHPSHTQEIEEALFLALAGRSVERRVLTHCYQIANHAKDIYADDITLSVGPAEKLVAYLESGVAAAVADRPSPGGERDGAWFGGGHRTTPAADPQITAVNAAFAVALLERHDSLPADHRLHDLAHAAGADAPDIDLDWFVDRFKTLARDPSESEYRRALAGLIDEYAAATAVDGPAAD